MMWLAFALVGACAGFLAGYLGIGGGLVVVPALTLIFSLDPQTAPYAVHLAVATSLSTMLVSSLSSILAHHRKKAILWGLVRGLVPSLAIGAVLGALVADQLSRQVLATVFGLFALAAGCQLMFSKPFTGNRPLPGTAGRNVTGLVIGSVSSMVGIGGGSMTAPWLMWHGRSPQTAIATAAACGYPIAVAGSVSFALFGAGLSPASSNLGYIHLPAFASIAMFSVLTAPLGAAIVHRSPAALVRKLFAVVMWAVAARMLFQAAL